jgi:peptide/nickel transport system substrate-binding protein
MRRRTLIAGGLALAGARPGRAADVQQLRMAVSAAPANLDPQYYTLTPSNMVAAHMFETLVQRNPVAKMGPGLAESWRLLDETTWEFTLRENVRFHDGSVLAPEDVVYTLARVPTVPSPGSFAVYTRGVKSVEVTGPRTFVIHTGEPYPLLPNDLSNLFILPRSLGADVPSTDFNSGKAAQGTGPFRFESYKPGDQLVLVRNPAYWGKPPIWDRVTYRIISNPAARVAALLSGDVDMIDNVPTTDALRLAKDTRIAISQCPSLRLIFIGLDSFRDTPLGDVTGPNGEALSRNPFKDRRVREALSLAINRDAIVDRVMEGAAVAAGQFMPAGSFGYAPDLTPPKFDAARARALLTEAGFPGGFSVVLHGSNDRYVNDGQILQVIAQQWTRIGVKTQVDGTPFAALASRLARFECSSFLLGWSNPGGEPSAALRNVMGTANAEARTGGSNYGRYSNPEVDKVTAASLRTLDDTKRDGLMQDAMRLAMRDTALIPLHLQKNVWATRKGLTYDVRVDEQTLAASVRTA